LYCYACNDAVKDPQLGIHLKTFGIQVDILEKTEKNMAELVSNPTFLFFSS